ncbi:hypothetical protein BKA58DRAFT_387407 [Alternaria rosae]|uniref:uncharacterized protein n=1 Tax=Alternaria rosae TaxID=1187941 RepID=UPI001E8E2CDD|nr:uncharacterized protein BKA58DRAFT_387407 [Alternaria rosae]KAH6868687.1 hypothetical protein BKA58DRAFT_387407 [Alternaria rosae]
MGCAPWRFVVQSPSSLRNFRNLYLRFTSRTHLIRSLRTDTNVLDDLSLLLQLRTITYLAMRSSMIVGAVAAFAPIALAQSSSAITSMVPMMSPSAPPVTMAWDNKPAPTGEAALSSGASSLNSAMKSAMSSMSKGMSMGSGMTMSDGMVMPTGSAMAGMSNFTGSAGKMEVGSGGVAMMAAILAML